MLRIENETVLIKRLNLDILETDKKNIVVLAGHFPLVYTRESAIEAVNYWGEFSAYTLELGCHVAKNICELGKNVKFVFFVDDHSYEKMSGLGPRALSARRNRLYAKRNGFDAKILDVYKKIMQKQGFNEQDILRHNHGKSGREDCLYFSEKILRASEKNIANVCAKAYVEFLEDKRYFDKQKDYMLAFVPQPCRGNVCDVALDIEVSELSASHIFMSTDPELTREQMFTNMPGVIYRKD